MSIREEIRRNFKEKPTEELMEIWKKNDRNQWSDTTFEVIQALLNERGIDFRPQEVPKQQEKELSNIEFEINQSISIRNKMFNERSAKVIKCPDCGKDLTNSSPPVWCKCGHDFRHTDPRTKHPVACRLMTTGEKFRAFRSSKYRWIDDDGLIRKYRNWLLGILSIMTLLGFGTSYANNPNIFGLATGGITVKLIVLFLLYGFALNAANSLISYDLKTWQHSKNAEVMLAIGLLFAILPGIFLFFWLRKKEQDYIRSIKVDGWQSLSERSE